MPRGRLATGLHFSRYFTEDDQDVVWTTRDIEILGADGRPVFQAEGVEVPETWSPLATQIAASKYMRRRGVPGTGGETSVRQVVDRIVRAIQEAGKRQDHFAGPEDAEVFGDELRYLLLHQKAAFNSPVWFNLGLREAYGIEGRNGHWAWDDAQGDAVAVDDPYVRPQVSACFIQGIDDSLVGPDGIFDLVRKEAQLFKYGSGTGTNFSPLRSRHETLSGGGTSSGLMSFLKVFDAAAGATKSGGTTRRAAKMVCLDIDHPEIEEFIDWKMKEEDKARALIEAGYDGAWDGEAYASISGQNSNNSVRVPDAFMRAVEADGAWTTRLRTGEAHAEVPARRLWDKIIHAAWSCADPGVQFHDTINQWHTCKATDAIHASNPCSEYVFLDDSACNLASLDLMRFWDDGFDVEGFQHAIRIVFTAQDILITHAGYPTQAITRNSERFRPLGLGYADLGALLMAQGLAYDSPEGRGLAAAITSLMTGTAYAVSAELAAALGPFQGIDDAHDGVTNREHMQRVMAMHRDAAARMEQTGSPVEGLDASLPASAQPILHAAVAAWDEATASPVGWRNAQATVLAPTGTIGLLMDCDTTGVEPDFSLVKLKSLAGGGVTRIINRSVPKALRSLGYSEDEIRSVQRHALGTGSLDGGPVEKGALRAAGFTEEQYQEAYDHVAATGRFDENTPAIHPAALREAGFSRQAVDALQKHVEGHQTVEGSLVRDEHLPVFDCANRCGDGSQSIAPLGHVRMMAAVQPFLSGAISKTVNLPHDATEDDVRTVYEQAWRLGLKAVAVYRDGCKASQPLATGRKRAQATPPEPSLRAAMPADPGTAPGVSRSGMQATSVPRGRMEPPPRDNDSGFKRTVSIFTPQGKVVVDIHVWEYADGRPCEVFVGARRSGTMVDEFLKEIGRDYSRILQLGLDLDTLTGKLMHQHGPLAGQTDHPYIKRVLGIQDLLGKLLRYEYFGETRFLSIQPDPEDPAYQPPRRETLARIQQAMHRPRNEAKLDAFSGDRLPPADPDEAPGPDAPTDATAPRDPEEEWLQELSGDAPPCDQCGHTTVRNGACYKCLNCGTSMGCS